MKKTLRGYKIPARGRCEIFPFATMKDVKACAKACDSPFFDPGTMRWWRSRVGADAYADKKGGAYFVTSEQFVGSDGVPAPREYKVRHYTPDCSIDTVDRGYRSKGPAVAWIKKRLAEEKPRDQSSLFGAQRRKRRRSWR